MIKTKTFVCYSKITELGVNRILYRDSITPDRDSVFKGNGVFQTAEEHANYLLNIFQSNTLYPVEVINQDLLIDLEIKIQDLIDKALQENINSGLKLSMMPSPENSTKGAILITNREVAATSAEKTPFNLSDELTEFYQTNGLTLDGEFLTLDGEILTLE